MKPLALLLLALTAATAGCLDFGLLGTPLDGGAGEPMDATVAGQPDLQMCVGITGGKAECMVSMDCPFAYGCVTSDGPGVCLLLCSNDADCTCPGSFCVTSGNSSFCSRLCDLVAQTGCPADSACDISNSNGHPFTFCRGLGTTKTGDTCNVLDDCVAGDTCIDGANPACVRWCTKGGCPNGQSCDSLSPAVVLVGKSYGICE